MGNFIGAQQSLVMMGKAAYKNEKYHDAIDFLSKAVEQLKPGSLERAACLDYLTESHWRLGDIDEALKCSKEALAIKQTRAPDSSDLARTLSNIGCIFFERGEYEKALDLLEGSLAIREKVAPNSLGVAKSSTNLALVLAKLGRRADALERHQQARKIKEQKEPDSESLAKTYINLSGHSSYQQGMEYLNMAQNIIDKKKPAPISLSAFLDFNRGSLLKAAGRRSAAIALFEIAIEKERTVAPDSLIMAAMLDKLANAREEKGLQPEARAARGESIDIRYRKAPTYLENRVLKK